jgi:hypothetical protein
MTISGFERDGLTHSRRGQFWFGQVCGDCGSALSDNTLHQNSPTLHRVDGAEPHAAIIDERSLVGWSQRFISYDFQAFLSWVFEYQLHRWPMLDESLPRYAYLVVANDPFHPYK